MARTREATATIKGYYYQFDLFILELLQLPSDDDRVCLEGIEDVDRIIDGRINAIQCKYYEGTRCSPSVVGKAVRPMLCHFASNHDDSLSYSLYGKYESGQESIPEEIDVWFAKERLFSYTDNKQGHLLHDELGLDDSDIRRFLDRLHVDVHAQSYDEQEELVFETLSKVFNCGVTDAKYFYYNNALRVVKDVAVLRSRDQRTLTRGEFIKAIGTKSVIFDAWYIERVGFRRYYSEVRSKYFTRLNVSPSERLFLIECDAEASDRDLMRLVWEISKRWGKHPRRGQAFCPTVYLHSVDSQRLKRVKRLLLNNGIHVWDGHEFLGADFSADSLVRKVPQTSDVRLKFVNEHSQIGLVLAATSKRKEVYQFYLGKPFYETGDVIGANLQIQRTMDVLKII